MSAEEKEVFGDVISRKYPALYKDCFDFSFGPGWNDIVEKVSKKLDTIVKRRKKEAEKDKLAWCIRCGHVKSDHKEDDTFCNEYQPPYPRVLQTKEKFGYLNIYMSEYDDEIDKVITEAVNESRRTCETCGKPAESRIALSHISTLCDEHFMERLERQWKK